MASHLHASKDILIAGSLCKRTKITKKWKKQYWRLFATGMLYYFKDIQHSKPLGQVDIKSNCYDVRQGAKSSKVTFPAYIPDSCCFSISLSERSYYLYAETPSSASEWVRLLGGVSGVVSRRRSETDAQFRELERRRIALRNARLRRSKRNRPDTISVNMVLECVEGELDHLTELEDPYVTILPPSPSMVVSSTSTLLRRSTSVPDVLNSNFNCNQLQPPALRPEMSANCSTSMRSLYESEVPLSTPVRVAPPPPILIGTPGKKNKAAVKLERRRSIGEDHPTLQRNTVLRETRKTYKKNKICFSPEVTSTTFQFDSLDNAQKPTCQSEPTNRNTAVASDPRQVVTHSSIATTSPATTNHSPLVWGTNVTAAPKEYRSSDGAYRTTPLSSSLVSPPLHEQRSFMFSAGANRMPSPVAMPIYDVPVFPEQNNHSPLCSNSSAPVKYHAKIPHQKSASDCVAAVSYSPPVQYTGHASDSHFTPVVNRYTKMLPRPQSVPDFMAVLSPVESKPFSYAHSPPPAQGGNFSAPLKRFTKMSPRRQSVPDFVSILAASPPPVEPRPDSFSSPVKRFAKMNPRRQSMPDFMDTAPICNPEVQKRLHKALGGARPKSVLPQLVIAELQIASSQITN